MSAVGKTILAISLVEDQILAKEAWLMSMAGPIAQLTEQFSRLIYCEAPVTVLPPASDDEIQTLQEELKVLDRMWTPAAKTQGDMRKLPRLMAWVKTHAAVIQHNYCLFLIKCLDPTCCSTLRMPQSVYDEIRCRSQPIPFPMHTPATGRDHFADYEVL
jgi:hypothetical protein